jgi:phage terminase large subunit
MKTTPVFSRILKNIHKRTQILQGGTSSSKTYSILQFFYILALQSKTPMVMSIVGETLPHLKIGALRDFIHILGDNYDDTIHNKTDNNFKIGNSLIEFFAIDEPRKARGSRRDILFINECNNVPKELYEQLSIRTKAKIFLDFNPTSHFWAHELITRYDVSFDKSTYRDNPYLSKSIIADIESRRDNLNWWRVYGEGEIGSIEGLILPDFELIDTLPIDLETECGLDFGFTNDPSCLLEYGIRGGAIYVNELFYKKGLTNQDICAELQRLRVPLDYVIYADSAEPKSIEEIYRAGWRNIKPCIKGEGYFNLGIDFIRRYKIRVTKKSLNVIKDFRNASWQTDKDGTFINKPAKGYLHAIDALRYAVNSLIQPRQIVRGYK